MTRKWIHNPFGVELPKQLERDELDELVFRLRRALITKSDIDRLYMGHIRLGMFIASQSAYSCPSLIYDFVSESALAIAEAIKSAPTKLYDNNITPYISARIRGRVIDFIENQFIMKPRTYRRLKGLIINQDIDRPITIKFPVFNALNEAHNRIETVNDNTFEILDEIESCINHDDNLIRREYKRAVIRLRTSRYSNAEIAKILDISESYVQKMMSDIEKEYNRS